jgi:hypothetical protein
MHAPATHASHPPPIALKYSRHLIRIHRINPQFTLCLSSSKPRNPRSHHCLSSSRPHSLIDKTSRSERRKCSCTLISKQEGKRHSSMSFDMTAPRRRMKADMFSSPIKDIAVLASLRSYLRRRKIVMTYAT